jgi:hypothetical protein
LAGNGLAVEDEEGSNPVRLPLIKLLFDTPMDARQATKGRDKRLVTGKDIEMESQEV